MSHKPVLYFATSNKNKIQEAQQILGMEINSLEIELNEPQTNDFRIVVLSKINHAISLHPDKHIFVEDSGLVLEAYDNFPGTFSKWIHKSIGLEGILKLLEGKPRGAKFYCYLAYYNPDKKEIKIFVGETKGKISKKILGDKGFGHDPIFIPEGYNETYAQNPELKNKTSHRKKALEKLKNHLDSQN